MVKHRSLCFCLPYYNAELTYWTIFADYSFTKKYLGTKPLTKNLYFRTRTWVFDSSWFHINNLGFYIQVSLQSVFFVSLKTFRKWNNVSLQRREKCKRGRGKLITRNALVNNMSYMMLGQCSSKWTVYHEYIDAFVIATSRLRLANSA